VLVLLSSSCTSNHAAFADESPGTATNGQAAAGPGRTPSLDKAQAEQNRLAIEAEIEQLGPDHPWAGVYTKLRTDVHFEFAVAPEAGFAWTQVWQGRRTLVSSGRVRFADDVLTLEPEFWSSEDGAQARSLFGVHWGTQHYFLTRSEIVDYCNAVNSNPSARRSLTGALRRDGGVRLEEPVLPELFRAWLFEQPLHARIVHLDAAPRTGQPELPHVVFDVGSDHGVFVGMAFFPVQPGDLFGVAIVSVDRQTCTAEASQRMFTRLHDGAEFSTRAHESR
jgi:hypothetical protein